MYFKKISLSYFVIKQIFVKGKWLLLAWKKNDADVVWKTTLFKLGPMSQVLIFIVSLIVNELQFNTICENIENYVS
jgi:hypothetical protein